MNTADIFAHDAQLNCGIVAGIDEAGRGPLAGPVVAACVIMPSDCMVDGIDDSKKLSEKKREALYDKIIGAACAYGVGIVDNYIIDEINILNATKNAMRDAFAKMGIMPDIVLIDAVKNLGLPCKSMPIIKGDAKSYNIAAASIVAKVTRDRLMRKYDVEYPAYGFSKNKGYGTAEHINALIKSGACPLHRKTFIKNFVGKEIDE